MPENKRGFAPLAIIALVAVLAVGGFVLWKKGGSFLPGLGQIAPRVTEKDFEFVEDSTLRKHFVAQANQSTYRTKTYSSGADLTFVSEVQIKGENFNTRDLQYEPGDKEVKHKIEIGDTVYIKDYSADIWWEQTVKLEEMPEAEDEEEPIDFKTEYSKPDLQFKALGKEACGNLNCFKYQQEIADSGFTTTRTFWFDDQKYLLRKEEVAYGEFKSSIEYSYTDINIVAPSPTKAVPEGQSIYDYYYGNVDINSGTPANYQLPSDGQPIPTYDFEIPQEDFDY